jgi:outer membrane lipoprotein carrier protein
MNASTRFFTALLTVALILGSAYSSVQAQRPGDVIERLKAKYDKIESLRAEFNQTMTSSYSPDKSTSSGVLVMMGDQYRVETSSQTLVTNGRVTWVYLPAENQVLINDFVKDESSFSLNDFFFNYDKHYNVSDVSAAQIAGQKHHVLTLTPKSRDSLFETVTLSMRDRDDVVTRLRVTDVNGTTMDFTLTNIQLNPSLGAGTFTFSPPSNAEVIDLRS